MKTKDSRKTNIEMLRFIGSLIILTYHSTLLTGAENYYFSKGYLCVELYFMLSGYFLLRHIREKNINGQYGSDLMKWSSHYTIRKLKGTFPYVVVGTIICYIWRYICLRDVWTLQDMINEICFFPYEVTLLNLSGLSPVFADTPLWYLSALLIVMPIVGYVMARFEDVYEGWMSWMLPILIYGWMFLRYGGVNCWGNDRVFLLGAIRALAGLTLGGGLYLFSNQIKEKNFSRTSTKIMMSLAEILGYIAMFCGMNGKIITADSVIIGIIFFTLALSLSGMGITEYLDSRFFRWLGSLSLPIFCIHWGVLLMVEEFLVSWCYFSKLMFSMVATVFIAAILQAVVTGFRGYLFNRTKRVTEENE